MLIIGTPSSFVACMNECITHDHSRGCLLYSGCRDRLQTTDTEKPKSIGMLEGLAEGHGSPRWGMV